MGRHYVSSQPNRITAELPSITTEHRGRRTIPQRSERLGFKRGKRHEALVQGFPLLVQEAFS